MKKLDWYIIRNFLSTVFFVLILFSIISMVFDMAEKLDNILEKDVSLGTVLVEYYLNFIPYILNLVSPLLIFISAVYFTSRLAYRSEFIAMLSSGVSFYRLMVPYLVVAIVLTGLTFLMQNYVVPRTNEKMLDFEAKYIAPTYYVTDVNIHRQLEPGLFAYMEVYNVGDSLAYKFSLEKFEGRDLVYKLLTRIVKWDGKQQKWVAHNYIERKINGLHEEVRRGDTMTLDIPMHPQDFSQKKRMSITTMTTGNLREFIRLEKLRGEALITYYMVELHKRYAVPFATFILIVIAVSVSSRKVRGGIGMNIGIGFLIALSYLVFLQFSSTFATNANLAPALAVWLPNIIFGLLAIYLLIKAPK